MELYLIRHGDCFEATLQYFCEEKQTTNPPLTSKGIRQAHQLANRLRGVKFDKIYTSDLDRAIHTANILHTSVNAEVVISKRLREIDMGEICKKSWDAFPELHTEWVRHEEDIPYPNGENGADVWRRCKQEMDEAIALGHQRIAIVCHGGTIRSIICGILHVPQCKRFYLGAPLENCSISIITHRENDFFLHTFNDSNHMTEVDARP